ncbi:Ldh family oxidoreductase [Mangrovicoccus sp. HB161399]|uniref:Ldh family oxidoreductase n=1 Tax=Mangrovicoccus sp. HB161399 TaxID=2720392 RepID=UPI001556B792|nr:Ldh family oxidoreductase [Mangrovicoccus sp. HB161399]
MHHIPHDTLRGHAAAILEAAGMDPAKAAVTADVLVEGDMIGHDTHGVGLLPWYADALAQGGMAGTGEHEVVRDRGGAIFVWDGKSLPGAWLVSKALEQACARVADHGVVTATIRNSHHTCALAAFMRKVTDQGYVVRLSSSNPGARRMAPFGGTEPLLTPNPTAMGFPTAGDPILIDISCSITTVTMSQSLAAEGKRYPEAWALTADGQPTDDPKEFTERGGTLLPLGGQLKGYKGFSMAIGEEMLGQGLSGKGRANTAVGEFAQNVFLQVLDPEAFAGHDAFLEQSTWLAETCRATPAAQPGGSVRMPGDRAAAKRRAALADGVPVSDYRMDALCALASRLGVPALAVSA